MWTPQAMLSELRRSPDYVALPDVTRLQALAGRFPAAPVIEVAIASEAELSAALSILEPFEYAAYAVSGDGLIEPDGKTPFQAVFIPAWQAYRFVRRD